MGDSTSDVISNLPPDVLEKILMCLTIQDAAMTSVLSRKWRYIWTTLPQLVFRGKSFRGSMLRAKPDKLMITIYKVLLFHHGPILKFVLSSMKLTSCPEIDQFLYFVSSNGIRELTLHIHKGEPYKLPSTLFSCLQLEHLSLRSCVLKPPPAFKGFTKLLSIELYEVFIAGDVLSCLASSCLLLERLTVHSSTTYDHLEIVAPNLKCLRFKGLFRSICIRMPSVAKVAIILRRSRKQLGFNEGEISNSIMLLGSLTLVEVLVLDYPYVKCMAASGLRERLPTTLNNLKDLRLHDICFGEPDEVSIVLYLIRCSPNLKEISIRSFHGATAAIDSVLELYHSQGWSGVSPNKLLYVLMEKVSGTKVEMEFIKLLLAKSPMLRTMDIKLKSKEVAEELRILKELIRFRRASADALQSFYKYDNHMTFAIMYTNLKDANEVG